MYRSNPNNPKQQELELRERLVKGYANQARFFQNKAKLEKDLVKQQQYLRQSKAALGNLSHLQYNSLEDLRTQAESQEMRFPPLGMGQAAEAKQDKWQAVSEKLQALALKQSDDSFADHTPKKLDWTALSSKLEALAKSQSEEDMTNLDGDQTPSPHNMNNKKL